MKLTAFLTVLCLVFVCLFTARGYTDLSPSDVHDRLVSGDTLLLIDVREVSEYYSGHIAEPAGRLPLTPVLMPWMDNVLKEEYQRLPDNVDLVLYCYSGFRSAEAASFLESKGFTRVFNMTGGYSSWTYEYRTGGFGNHSGSWIRPSDSTAAVIHCSLTGNSSSLAVPVSALPADDSLYIELNMASSSDVLPPGVPASDIEGLFRITVLDHFGLSQFTGDSLLLADTVDIRLYPISGSFDFVSLASKRLSVHVPGSGWKSVSHSTDSVSFIHQARTLRTWYALEGYNPTDVPALSNPSEFEIAVFPNPFCSSVRIEAPAKAEITVFDITGRLITRLASRTWTPDASAASGMYLVHTQLRDKTTVSKIVYMGK